MASIKDKVRQMTGRAKHRTLADLLTGLNPVLRGWCNDFRHGVCKRTFGYVDHYAFGRVINWLKKRHPGLNMHTLIRRYVPRWEISDGGIEMFRPGAVAIERYRFRGNKIPTPWTSLDIALQESTIGLYKTELVEHERTRAWTGPSEVERDTASWVHWYNQTRLHLSIGRMSPVRYEALWAATQPAESA